MLEMFLALLGVLFSPQMAEALLPRLGIGLTAIFMDKVVIFCLIIAITLVTNIIRALRYCRDKKGGIASLGIWYGIKKGIVCGFGSLIPYIIIGLVPVLRVPFTVIGLIPYLGSIVNGLILSFFYLLSYVIFAYPIWGVC
jgi:hypothetical protein